MTTADIRNAGTISTDMINFLGRAVVINGKPSSSLPEQGHWQEHGGGTISRHTPPVWAEPTIKAILALPWDRDNWADGATRTRPEAAGNLLLVMVNTLNDDTPPPTSVVPTWRGGIQAEWHIGGFDLEIESEPDGTAEYYFAGPDVDEFEGPVDGNIEHLRKCASLLSSRE